MANIAYTGEKWMDGWLDMARRFVAAGAHGLEVFTIHENEGETVRFMTPGAAMRDAHTGELLWKYSPAIDIVMGMAADIDPRHRGPTSISSARAKQSPASR